MYKNIGKRILDVLIALLLLAPLFLVTIIIGSAIIIEDGFPILYSADRLGYRGEIFKMHKFRSMKNNAPDIRNSDGSTFNAENDPRVTRVGRFIRKTSLDELPQILNVLKGEMSFIGPRPDLPPHKELYVGNEIEKLNIKPGITGYSQAYYRNSIPWKEKIQHDIDYINNLSLMLDIKIIIQTLKTVILRQDVYIEQ